MPNGEDYGINWDKFTTDYLGGLDTGSAVQEDEYGIDWDKFTADRGHVPSYQDQPVPFLPSDQDKYELKPEIKQENLLSNIMAEHAIDDDVAKSVYQSIKASPNSEELLAKLDTGIKEKATFANQMQYVSRRAGSMIPFLDFDYQKYRGTPIEFQRVKDRDAGELYDPIAAFHIPLPGGGEIDVGDVSDLAVTIGEFYGIGAATKKPFEWVMKSASKSKPFTGVVKLAGATQRRKNLIKRVAKSNLDFQIHNITSIHPEDTQEGATLKKKIDARVKRIPATALNASLFGALGGFENTFAQYGGVFTAGYSTTFIDMVNEQRKRGDVDYAKANKEAMKSGFLLVGAHYANVLGTKGVDKFREWGKEKGLSETALNDLVRTFVTDKKANETERWRSKGMGSDNIMREVTIDGETTRGGKEVYILKDAHTEKTHTMVKNKFHDNFLRSASPAEKTKVRSRKIQIVKRLQARLGFDKSGHQEQNLKQEIFETKQSERLETREWRVTDKKVNNDKKVGDKTVGQWQKDFEGDKVTINEMNSKTLFELTKELGIKTEKKNKQTFYDAIQDYWNPKRIRHYQQIDNMSIVELKKMLNKNNVNYKPRATKKELIELVKSNVEIEPGKRISWTEATTEQLDRAITELQTENSVRSTIRDIKLGIYQGDLKNFGAKVYDDATHAIVSTDVAIEKHSGDLVRGAFHAEKIVEKGAKVLKENGIITEEQQRKIILASANRDGKKKNHPTPEDLTDAEYKVYEFYTETLEELGLMAMREGAIENMIENYFVGLYAKQMPSAVSRKGIERFVPSSLRPAYEKVKRSLFGAKKEDVDLFRAQTINQQASLPTNTKFSLQKLVTTPLDVEGTNLKPNYNILDHLGEWSTSVGRAMAGRQLAERLLDMPLVNGKLSISATQVPGYKKIYNRSLYQALTGKAREQAVWVHPEIAPSLEIVFKPGTISGDIGALRKVENFVKRIIMINPLIHGWNIYSDLMDEHNFRFIHAGKVALAGEAPETVVRQATGISKKEVSKMSKAEIAETYDKVMEEMAGEGVPIAKMMQITSEFADKANLHFSEMGSTFWDNTKNAMNEQGFGSKVKGTGRALRQWSDDFLWGKIVKNSMVSVYSIQKSKALKGGLTEEESRQAAAHYTKDLLGMLPKHVFSARGILSGESLNHLFFARNWTISNLRLMSGAMGYRGQSPKTRLLQHRGLNKRQMAHLQTEYTKHLLKGVLGLVATNNLLNWVMTSTVETEEGGKFKGFDIKPEKGRFAFENPPEKYLDAYTGLKDNKGRDIYLVNPLFRYIGDYFSWYKDPRATLFNKMHPVPKTSMEMLANRSFWANKAIVQYPDIDPKKWEKRGMHALWSLTPAGQFADQPGQARPFLERFVPFLGTWVRHGIAGDTEDLTFGSKINEYLREKNYEEDEVDKVINEMLVTGAEAEIILEYIKDEKRYKTLKSALQRLNKYRSPLVYKWDAILRSKDDKRAFLKRLSEYEREEFFRLMAKEKRAIAEERRREREQRAKP